jgi:hypothetical protein
MTNVSSSAQAVGDESGILSGKGKVRKRVQPASGGRIVAAGSVAADTPVEEIIFAARDFMKKALRRADSLQDPKDQTRTPEERAKLTTKLTEEASKLTAEILTDEKNLNNVSGGAGTEAARRGIEDTISRKQKRLDALNASLAEVTGSQKTPANQSAATKTLTKWLSKLPDSDARLSAAALATSQFENDVWMYELRNALIPADARNTTTYLERSTSGGKAEWKVKDGNTKDMVEFVVRRYLGRTPGEAMSFPSVGRTC